MPRKIPKSERRTLEQLKEDYLIERELADKLRVATKEERRHLYTALYDEFYRRVPRNPQSIRKLDLDAVARKVSWQVRLLRRFLNLKMTFLEVGPGDCTLAFEVAKFVKRVYAVDISEDITKSSRTPKNFELIISDGTSIPVPENSVDMAYSNQLMEHLHPDDALTQLRNIYKVLKVGGVYLCITPNRLTGPHDISKYFDDVATGFHLKEYTTTELANIFKKTGFSKISALVGAKGFALALPIFLIRWIESLLTKLPRPLGKKIPFWLPIRLMLNTKLVAIK